MIQTILWDVDATLLDFHAAEKAAIHKLFQQFHLGECSEAMLQRYAKINRGYWERLEKGELTRDQVLVGRFQEFFEKEKLDVSVAPAFNEAYQTALGDTIVYRDDSYQIIESLRGKVKQYVVSNGTIVAQEKKLRLSGLGALMDGVFLSEELGVEKPNKEFFDKVFAQIGYLDREKVMIVGDSLTSDMRGANNAGLTCCWYNPEGAVNDKGVRIDYEIKDLIEVEQLIGERV